MGILSCKFSGPDPSALPSVLLTADENSPEEPMTIRMAEKAIANKAMLRLKRALSGIKYPCFSSVNNSLPFSISAPAAKSSNSGLQYRVLNRLFDWLNKADTEIDETQGQLFVYAFLQNQAQNSYCTACELFGIFMLGSRLPWHFCPGFMAGIARRSPDT